MLWHRWPSNIPTHFWYVHNKKPYAKAAVLISLLFISGLWSSTVYLGAFAGPTAGGFFVENFGFAQSSVYFLFLFVFSTLMDLAELTYKIFFMPAQSDYERLTWRQLSLLLIKICIYSSIHEMVNDIK